MTQKESGASVFASLGRLVGIFTEREVFKIGNLLKPVTGQVICQFQPKGEKRRGRITRPQKFIQPLKKGGMRKWMTYINPDTFTSVPELDLDTDCWVLEILQSQI